MFFGVSRETMYRRIRAIETKMAGSPSTGNTAFIANPATAQGYEVTSEAYRTTAHQGGVV
jgi:uncharacterized protein YmfQ (DUF2313 family)